MDSITHRNRNRNRNRNKNHITHRNKNHHYHHQNKITKRKFKPLNCHPSLKKHNKKVLDHSCLTSETLKILKNTFNKHNPEKKIETTEPKEIWNNLYHKIPNCDKETCWLNSIPDKRLEHKLKKELFTPFQPSDWKTNKNAWLSNLDIEEVLKQYQQTYSPKFIMLGPTPIDFDTKKNNGQCVWNELCQLSLSNQYDKGVRKIGIIYNLDTHRGSGTHWVSMFIELPDENDENDENPKHKPFIFYFNSTAQRMPKEINKLIKRLQKQFMNFKGIHLPVYKNTKKQHQHSNSECGMYSLFFIITCLTRKTDLMPDKKLENEDLVELFAGKNRIDDKYVEKFRDIYFNPAS
jgi:hypothetical protein